MQHRIDIIEGWELPHLTDNRGSLGIMINGRLLLFTDYDCAEVQSVRRDFTEIAALLKGVPQPVAPRKKRRRH